MHATRDINYSIQILLFVRESVVDTNTVSTPAHMLSDNGNANVVDTSFCVSLAKAPSGPIDPLADHTTTSSPLPIDMHCEGTGREGGEHEHESQTGGDADIAVAVTDIAVTNDVLASASVTDYSMAAVPATVLQSEVCCSPTCKCSVQISSSRRVTFQS